MKSGSDMNDINMDEFWGEIRSMRQYYPETRWAAHVDGLLADCSQDAERWIAAARHIIEAYLSADNPAGEWMLVGMELRGGKRCNCEGLTHWKMADILQRISSVAIWYTITYDIYERCMANVVSYPVEIEGISEDSWCTRACFFIKWRSPEFGDYRQDLRVVVHRPSSPPRRKKNLKPAR